MPAMNPVSGVTLSGIQAALAATLDKDCAIGRKSVTKDAYGSQSETYATIATVKAGMAEPSGSQLQNLDFKIASLVAWQVKFAVGTDVQETDHLVIEGQTLEVYALLTPRSYPGLLTVIAGEVR